MRVSVKTAEDRKFDIITLRGSEATVSDLKREIRSNAAHETFKLLYNGRVFKCSDDEMTLSLAGIEASIRFPFPVSLSDTSHRRLPPHISRRVLFLS